MAFTLPPPPIGAEPGDFAWSSWQTSLYRSIAQPGSILWVSVDKAGSSLADLQNKNHGLLTGINGSGDYHISSTQAAAVSALSGTNSGDNAANTQYAGKLNGVTLSGLSTGILKNTTSTGIPSIAVAADFPTLNQNTTGSAATAAGLTGTATFTGTLRPTTAAGYLASDSSPGITTTITTASLTGKTITIKDGLIVGFA